MMLHDRDEVDPDQVPLENVVFRAWRVGKEIDLNGIGYGRAHWGDRTSIYTSPFPYYFFLAGFVRIMHCTKIVEIGTHHGGSTLAILRGLPDPKRSSILTFDINHEGAEMLSEEPSIEPVVMDANTRKAFQKCAETFPRGIDLAYLDAAHYFVPTLFNFALYGDAMNARYVILDDINLDDEMRKLWAMLQKRFGENAVDASAIIPAIKKSGAGFGLIRRI